MYGKIFASMFKGSLYGQWEALVTFTVMIVLADQHGEVDMTPEALSAATSIPLDIIRKGITSLEAPDPESRTPDEEGRRIVRVSDNRSWGWRITNYAHYRAIRTAEERREYFKQHKRKQRSTKRNPIQPLSTESPQSPPIAVSSRQEAEGEAQAVPTESDADFDRAWALYPRRSGANSRVMARRAWDARIRSKLLPAELLAGVERYAAFCTATHKVGTEYVMQTARFFGPSEMWAQDWTPPKNGAPDKITTGRDHLAAWANEERNGQS